MLHCTDSLSRCDTWHSGQRVQSWFHQTKQSWFSLSESPLLPFCKLQAGCHVASGGPLYHKALISGVLQRWLSFCHRGILELCQSNHWVLGHLADQGPSLPIDQFGQAVSSRKSLGGSKLLPFKNDGDHCSWEPSMLLVPFPRSVHRQNPVPELYGQFLRPHGLVFALTCTFNGGTLYRHVCTLPNNVQSIEFTTGGLQSSCKNISMMINGNRMHLSSISSLIAKGLYIYVNMVSVFYL